MTQRQVAATSRRPRQAAARSVTRGRAARLRWVCVVLQLYAALPITRSSSAPRWCAAGGMSRAVKVRVSHGYQP